MVAAPEAAAVVAAAVAVAVAWEAGVVVAVWLLWSLLLVLLWWLPWRLLLLLLWWSHHGWHARRPLQWQTLGSCCCVALPRKRLLMLGCCSCLVLMHLQSCCRCKAQLLLLLRRCCRAAAGCLLLLLLRRCRRTAAGCLLLLLWPRFFLWSRQGLRRRRIVCSCEWRRNHVVSLNDVEEDILGQHPRVAVHARTWGPPQAQERVGLS